MGSRIGEQTACPPGTLEKQNPPRGQNDFAFCMNDMYSPSVLELNTVSFEEFIPAPATTARLEDNLSCCSLGKYMKIWAIWLVSEITLRYPVTR